MTATIDRDPCFVADYRHLRDCGLTDDAIAVRLGMSRDTLRKHLDRNNIRLPLTPAQRRIRAAIERAAQRRPDGFTCDDLPIADLPHEVTVELDQLVRDGLLARVGRSRSAAGGGVSVVYGITGQWTEDVQ